MSATYPSQYYNRFDPSKRYKMLLFRAARGLQSAELNEIHSTLQNEIATIANTIFGDGSLLKGGAISRQGDTRDYLAASATFFAQGYTHQVLESSFTIEDMESVAYGIAVSTEVISESEDPTLRDPALNTRNFNEPGAHRLRYTARWCKETEKQLDEAFYSLAQFIDGVRFSAARAGTESSSTTDMIARLDYATNGSYVTNGLSVSFATNDSAAKQHLLSVAAGTARVEGYERILDTSQKIRTKFALDTRSIANELYSFTSDGEYQLRYSPIASVGEVNGVKQAIDTRMTHANFMGSADFVNHTPLYSIIAVNQNGTWDPVTGRFIGGITYQAGVDYWMDGDKINWNLPSLNEPAPGSTYSAVYQYSGIVTPSISSDLKKIIVSGFAPGTTFSVDYEHYIPRYDVVFMNRDGELKIVSGQPDHLNPVRPSITSGLQLASMYISYGSDPVITSDFYRAYKFSDIYRLESTLQDVLYNISKLSLLDKIRSTDPTVTKRGTFVDTFADDAQRDGGISQNAVSMSGALFPQVTWIQQTLRTGKDLSLPFSESVLLEQKLYTKSRIINAYAATSLPPATLTLSPKSYQWVTEKIINETTQDFRVPLINRALANDAKTTESSSTTGYSGVVALPQTTVKIVNANTFNAGEGVRIIFDGTLVATVNADSKGVLNTTFTTPVGTMSGSKEVRLEGVVSGVVGVETFTAQPLRETITRVTPNIVWYDPLAQTFAFPNDKEDYFISSIEIQFDVAPELENAVEIKLVEVQLGIPNRERALANLRLDAKDIKVGSGVWTKFLFETPVRIQANQEYAFIVLTRSVKASIRVAELNQRDLVLNQWVSKPAYETGVLLESANQSSWSPLPKEDATFRINRATFESTHTKTFDSLTTPTQVTDLMLSTMFEVLPDTSLGFTATLPSASNSVYNLVPFKPLAIPKYTGAINIAAFLKSSRNNLSPIIKGDVFLQLGVLQVPATYVTRAIPVPSGSTGMKIYLDIYEPSAASIVIQYRNQADTDWVSFPRVAASAVNIGNGVVEMPFSVAISGMTSTRIKITMDTTDTMQRPCAANLRLFFT